MLCKACKKRPINTERSICKCTECLDKALSGVKEYYKSHRETVLAYQKQYYAENKGRVDAYHDEYRKKNPDKVKRWSRVAQDKQNARDRENRKIYGDEIRAKERRYREENYERLRAKSIVARRIWREKNRDHVNAKSREYEHIRRARLESVGGSFSDSEWKSLLELYGNRCLCCGRIDVPLCADHVVPIAKGGTNTIDNIQPLCRSCNSRKHTKVVDYRPHELAIRY